LGRRPAQEGADEEELVRGLRLERRLGPTAEGERRLHLEPRALARRQAADGDDASGGEEDPAHEPRLERGHDDAAAGTAQPLEPAELADDAVERVHAVAQARRVL